MSEPHALTLHDALVVATGGLSLLGIGLGRVPGATLNRAVVAVVGAAAMVALDGGDIRAALRAIDGRVLVLLFALMVVASALADAGAFDLLAARVERARLGGAAMLVALVAVTGLLAAVLLNDAVVLMLTPAVVRLARRLGTAPLPYVLALALAANAGSVATVTANPQNVVAAVAGGVGYLRFAEALAPVALGSLPVVALVVWLRFRRDIAGRSPPATDAPAPVEVAPVRLTLAATAAAGMLAAFAAGLPVAASALLAAGLLLAAWGRKAGALLRAADLQLLVLVAGLFVIVGGVARTPEAAAALQWASSAGAVGLAGIVALASNLVSNVPAVLFLLPAAGHGGGGPSPTLTLAMASTLAGNLTLVGSIANLIVAEGARRHRVEVGFVDHLVVGVPVTVVTLALGLAWLRLR